MNGYEFTGFLGNHADQLTERTTAQGLATIARFHLRVADNYRTRARKRVRLQQHWLDAADQHEAYAMFLEHQAQEAQLRE
jgi:hypothetical protein